MTRRTDHRVEEPRGGLLVDVDVGDHRREPLCGRALEVGSRAGRGMVGAVQADPGAAKPWSALVTASGHTRAPWWSDGTPRW
jgi:hypothetical protein